MRTLLVLLLTTAPACADCIFVTESGARLTQRPTDFDVVWSDGSTTHCDTYSGGTGVQARGAMCEDGTESIFLPANSELDGGGSTIIFFDNAIWYAQGCE